MCAFGPCSDADASAPPPQDVTYTVACEALPFSVFFFFPWLAVPFNNNNINNSDKTLGRHVHNTRRKARAVAPFALPQPYPFSNGWLPRPRLLLSRRGPLVCVNSRLVALPTIHGCSPHPCCGTDLHRSTNLACESCSAPAARDATSLPHQQ